MLHLALSSAVHAQVEADPDERDAETRVAAVKALAAVACKLYAGAMSVALASQPNQATPSTHAQPNESMLSAQHQAAKGTSSPRIQLSESALRHEAGSQPGLEAAQASRHQPVQDAWPHAQGQPSEATQRQTLESQPLRSNSQAAETLQHQGQHFAQEAGVVRQHVVLPLLAAVEDYSTDNRSDSSQMASCGEPLLSLPLDCLHAVYTYNVRSHSRCRPHAA